MSRYDDPTQDLVACPECHNWMMPLKDFEISKISEAPTIDTEWWEFILWGWWAFLYSYLYNLMTYKERMARVEALKRDVLPHAPASLVCTKCLFVRQQGPPRQDAPPQIYNRETR